VPTAQGPSILCLDDFNRADPRIIRAIMQLLQNHETISWALPQQCTIVATANPEGGSEYAVTSLDIAMLSRARHITMKADVLEWIVWGQKNKLDSRILNFIARYQEMLVPEGSQRTCPRAWHMFSDDITTIGLTELLDGAALGDASTDAINRSTKAIELYGNALLDSEAVVAFITFLANELDKLVEPEDIVDKYPEVREKVLRSVRDSRFDIFTTMIYRVIGYLKALPANAVTEGCTIQKNVIALLEEDIVPKDMKHLITREMSDTPMSGHLVSEKLAQELGEVVQI